MLGTEELVLLLIWTKPVVMPPGLAQHEQDAYAKDEYAGSARSVLGIDGVQAHGLLRNCFYSDANNNNLINIVETYF